MEDTFSRGFDENILSAPLNIEESFARDFKIFSRDFKIFFLRRALFFLLLKRDLDFLLNLDTCLPRFVCFLL